MTKQLQLQYTSHDIYAFKNNGLSAHRELCWPYETVTKQFLLKHIEHINK